MTHPASEDKLDPQDSARRDMQPPIPTHPPDPLAAGEAGKVVRPNQPPQEQNPPPHGSTGAGSKPALDPVGGAGLGMALGEALVAGEKPATARERDTHALDQQERTGAS